MPRKIEHEVFHKNYRPDKVITDPGKSVVEMTGYISTKQRIEDMMNAGLRLEVARNNQYEFNAEDKVPDDYIDPTRNPGYDLADASAQMAQVNASLEAQKANKTSEQTEVVDQAVVENEAETNTST
jgi:hypothetical protein